MCEAWILFYFIFNSYLDSNYPRGWDIMHLHLIKYTSHHLVEQKSYIGYISDCDCVPRVHVFKEKSH